MNMIQENSISNQTINSQASGQSNPLAFFEGLKDFETLTRYKLGSALDLGKFAFKTGIPETVQGIIKYPWIGDAALNLNTFFDTLTKDRTGDYLEANALLTANAMAILFDLMNGFLTQPEKTVLHEDMVPCEIINAMGLNGWVGEMMSMVLPFISSTKIEDYIDISEISGVAPDTCSLPKGTIGMALADQMPECAAIVASNMPCDGGMTSYTVIAEKLKVPAFRLDIPYNIKTDRAKKYFVGELKRMIAFLEEHTPGKMDWDKLKEICEIRNKTVELEMELWEMLRQKPAPMAAEPVLVGHLFFLSLIPGRQMGVDYFTNLLEITGKIMSQGRGAIRQEKYRALLWNPIMASFPELMHWSEKTFGVSVLMDMMSYNSQPYIDTSSPETMLRDLGYNLMDGPMVRHTRGPSDNFFNDMFHLVDYLNLDMIWMAEHVGCKNTKALNGMFREMCRERNIPVLFIHYDLTDTRISPPAAIKKQITEFMETIMKAERLA